jgi:anti-sigma regulatory factor (Ser/Thr protein kinase)
MFSISITENSQVGEARRLAIHLANKLKFSEGKTAKIAIIVTEAANNLIKHTPLGGEILLGPLQLDDQALINIFALDQGPGISNIQLCLQDGYSTAGTPGTGLGAIKRLADDFDLHTQVGLGTILWAQVKTFLPSSSQLNNKAVSSKALWLETGAVCIPIAGEKLCGDGWLTHIDSVNGIGWCLVVDGLGHGEGAYEASQETLRIFNLHKNNNISLVDMMQKFHVALTKTRGTALALAKIDWAQKQLDYIGIGNISAVILTPRKRQSLISFGGIMGHSMRKLQTFSYPFPAGALLIMHSDGLISHWDLQRYQGLSQKPAPIIAGLLYRDYKRGRDDVTVIVVKNKLPVTPEKS